MGRPTSAHPPRASSPSPSLGLVAPPTVAAGMVVSPPLLLVLLVLLGGGAGVRAAPTSTPQQVATAQADGAPGKWPLVTPLPDGKARARRGGCVAHDETAHPTPPCFPRSFLLASPTRAQRRVCTFDFDDTLKLEGDTVPADASFSVNFCVARISRLPAQTTRAHKGSYPGAGARLPRGGCHRRLQGGLRAPVPAAPRRARRHESGGSSLPPSLACLTPPRHPRSVHRPVLPDARLPGVPAIQDRQPHGDQGTSFGLRSPDAAHTRGGSAATPFLCRTTSACRAPRAAWRSSTTPASVRRGRRRSSLLARRWVCAT